MGKGDKKTKKGKRFAGSYGRTRIRKVKTKQNFEKTKDKNATVSIEKKSVLKKKKTDKKTTEKKKRTSKTTTEKKKTTKKEK